MAKSKNEAKSAISSDYKEDLIAILCDDLNKSNKDLAGSFQSMGDVVEISEYISTGSSVLDLCISNVPHGGVPVGRVTEISGTPSSGKSLVAYHLIANTQLRAGLPVLFDIEGTADKKFIEAIGVDRNKVVYNSDVKTIERLFDAITTIVEKVRKSDKKRLVTIIVDSVAALTTEKEDEGDFSKSGFGTERAMLLSQAMRKINHLISSERICLVFLNQLRINLDRKNPYDDKYIVPGGMAIPFYSSVRVALSRSSSLKLKDESGVDVEVGHEVTAKIIKNKIGPPSRKSKFNMYYDSGINDYMSWLETLKSYKIITTAGAYNVYGDRRFYSKDFVSLVEKNQDLKEELYAHICKKLIVVYKNRSQVELSDDIIIEADEMTDDINL